MFQARLAAFPDLIVPRFLTHPALNFHTYAQMATDKDAGTPRIFLARHGLPIPVSLIVSLC